MTEVHELSKKRGVFADGIVCLADAYISKLPKGKPMHVLGHGMREMVLVEHSTLERICYYYADCVTGSLYSPHTGQCMSSNALRIKVN